MSKLFYVLFVIFWSCVAFYFIGEHYKTFHIENWPLYIQAVFGLYCVANVAFLIYHTSNFQNENHFPNSTGVHAV